MLAFSYLTCNLEDRGKDVFWLHNKETELGSSKEEASPWAGKNARLALESRRACKCVSAAMSMAVVIPVISWVSSVTDHDHDRHDHWRISLMWGLLLLLLNFREGIVSNWRVSQSMRLRFIHFRDFTFSALAVPQFSQLY